ncbi:hypothetical protein [Lactiplantibacillus mudanjiangensis]|uniref:Uncharacterized protein n=1 Tax=Lactiplantibacillus mudanjiangensis TaxID=1296538 RepID=A0A660EBB9_9LACO|nr:hypothetical protein [Lactiplantibacillus mudanjiangensis]VDG23720.1 hypothetical protein [Lactobacillus gallinarum] [Lactiplantibacillus mudanjiangensis]VDG29836.1 hypothetical protein [Lactobacillus gallinarum] [Lactiplantibacillus mudanjiangensis]
MSNEKDYIKEIIKQFKIINSNKLNSEETINYFNGCVYALILNKTVFRRNDDLPSFVYGLFLKPFDTEQYKQYVYKSRTLLGARVCRHINDDLNYSQVVPLSKAVISYLEKTFSLEQKKEDTQRLNSIADELSGWLKQ